MLAGKCWAAAALAVATGLLLAGCLPCLSGGRPATVAETPVPISEDAANRLAAKAEAMAGQDFRVEFSEQEVTSYVALRLTDAVPLAALQVRFLPGRILLAGDLTSPVRVHVTLEGSARAVDGRPELLFREASLGGLAVPSFLLGSLADSISEMVGQSQGAMEIREIELAAGRIIISGRSQQRQP